MQGVFRLPYQMFCKPLLLVAKCVISESTVVLSIIIGIAMGVLSYFGPMEKLKFHFHFQFPLNLTYTNTKVGNMLKANDI